MMSPDVFTFCEKDMGRHRRPKGGIPSPEANPSPHSPAVPFRPQEHMTAAGNCQTFSSSTVISYSNTGAGAPKVYQETAEMRSAPGGVSWRAPPVPEEARSDGPHRNPGCFFQDWVAGGLSGLVQPGFGRSR